MVTKIHEKKIKIIDRKAFFTNLYQKTFPLIAGYIRKSGGSLDDAKDIFHDSLIIYYEKVLIASFVPEHSEKAYLFGISKHLWSKQYKENNRYISRFEPLTDDGKGADLIDLSYKEASSGKLLQLLHTAGQKCMELLSAFYYEKLNMEKLAERFGFSGTHSATVQKYKCLEKVKDTVKEKSLQYEDFIE